MQQAFVVRGHLRDPRNIELDEPLAGMLGDVELVVRTVDSAVNSTAESAAKSIESWERAFDGWVLGHDRSVPVPPPASMRREEMYEERT